MKWPKLTTDPLSQHQVDTVALATTCNFGILGGSPGTGKTFTVAQIAKQLGRTVGFDEMAACAPTGKAAVRLSEAFASYGIPMAARTIHSLLGVTSAEGGWNFNHNRSNPLPFKVIFVDESSMIDTDLAAAFFAARARDCMVLWVGDVNQLPPVGHGAPLRDMIAAGVPYGELTEIRRQVSSDEVHAVVQACADIRDGKRFICQRELISVPAFDPAIQIDEMFDAINASATALHVDSVWGVQVLCAVNKKSDLSRAELNKVLQARLNPLKPEFGSPFRLHDKVVNTKNGWFPMVEQEVARDQQRDPLDPNVQVNAEGKCYVANGELGEVVYVAQNFMQVRLSSPKRLIVVPRGQADDDGGDSEESTGTGCNWDLGYALSCHKSQGSEWPAVIVMVDGTGGAARVCSREWIYTAISRAKRRCYLVGDLNTAQGFCRRRSIGKRKTFLTQRILEGLQTL